MKNFYSRERQFKKLELDLLKKQNALAELNITKREAEIELIKEQIMSAKSNRRLLRIGTSLTGFSLLVTILNHFGLFTDK